MLTLKPNTYYKTRDGRKAFVGFRHPSNGWVGYIETEPYSHTWLDNGRWCSTKEEFCRDLIAEWTDAPEIGSNEWAIALPAGTKIRWKDWPVGTWTARSGGGLWCTNGTTLRIPGDPTLGVNGWSLYVESPAVGSSAWANSLPVGSKVRFKEWSEDWHVTKTANGWTRSHEILAVPGQYIGTPSGWLLYTEPKLRPWKPEEVPLGAHMRCKVREHRFLLTETWDNLIRKTWLDEYEHSTDGGKTWKPCGVEE